ncbi:hypothetical protein [Rhodobacteraceae bacterium DSL-40]|uniref:hypothetical protein n=1 Tax=Amaricoccus sp. B4 TaxID=3368557 RepID=UPI000DAC3076
MFVIQIGLPGVSAHFLQRHILAKARDLIVLRRGQGAPEPVLATLRAYVRCNELKAQLLRFRLHSQLAPLIQRARAEERTVVLADEFLAFGATNFWHNRGPSPEKVARRIAGLSSYTVTGLTPIRVSLLLRRQDQWLAERYATASSDLPMPSQSDFDARIDAIIAATDPEGPFAWLDHRRIYRDFARELGVDNILVTREERLARRPRRTIAALANFVESGDLPRTMRQAIRLERTAAQTGMSAPRMTWQLNTTPPTRIDLGKARRRQILSHFADSEKGLHRLIDATF